MATHSSTTCLENPMDRGAWQAAVHVVVESRTRLSDFTFMYWRRKWQPTPVFLPGESQGRGSLVGCRLWGRTELDTTEATQQQHVPTGKGADLRFTSFLDARGNGQLRGNRRARVEKGTLLGHLWVDRFGRHGLIIKKNLMKHRSKARPAQPTGLPAETYIDERRESSK